MINQNNHNVWIQQPLLAAEFLGTTYPMGLWGWVTSKGDKIEVAFQQLPSVDINGFCESGS